MQTAAAVVAAFLRDVGSFFVFMGLVFGSGWYLLVKIRETATMLRTRQLTPIPDKRASQNLVGILVVVGVWLLFLWVALLWIVV